MWNPANDYAVLAWRIAEISVAAGDARGCFSRKELGESPDVAASAGPCTVGTMQPFPHIYAVGADGSTTGTIVLTADGVSDLASAAPREFDGPGDEWSPESLLVAAVASCFILTFRAVARAAKLEWTHLECSVSATLERREGSTQFTRFVTQARLTVPGSTLVEACEKALHKAEATCLVANSLRGERELQTEILHEELPIALP